MLPDPILIRDAIPLDRSHILSVNRRTWESAYTHIFSKSEIVGLFHNVLHQHGTWVYRRNERIGTLVAEVNGELVGFIGMASLLNESAAEITTFYILPAYHGQGIGKRLWQAAIQRLRNDAYAATWVWVLEKAAARQFYEGQGCIARQHGIYTVGNHQENAIGYWLDL